MNTPDRTLRAIADEDPTRIRRWSPRQRERHTLILRTATRIFARVGFAAVTFRGMATALAIGTGTLRQHFVDLESLLAEILRQHLEELCQALAATQPEAAAPEAARRQAYLRQTRTYTGFSEPHLLWIRERHALPQDLKDMLEETLAHLANVVAGPDATPDQATRILALLDNELVISSNVEEQIAQRPRLNLVPRTAAPPPNASLATGDWPGLPRPDLPEGLMPRPQPQATAPPPSRVAAQA